MSGRLRERVRFEQEARTGDGAGGFSITWTTVAVRWAMLDGTESLGMAGVLHIKGKQAKYQIYRIRPGEAKVEGK